MFAAVTAADGFEPLGEQVLIGPSLLWTETRSALHVARWRGLISEETAAHALSLLRSGPVKERRPQALGSTAWRIADELQWSKTYDAEYLALAASVKGSLVTLDRRLLRAAQRLDLDIFPIDR